MDVIDDDETESGGFRGGGNGTRGAKTEGKETLDGEAKNLAPSEPGRTNLPIGVLLLL
jgi:hypothetical protein